MNLNLTPFQEPRGVMRVLQLVFAICAFTTVANFSIDYTIDCQDFVPNKAKVFTIDYPFKFYENVCRRASNNESLAITADVSTDAQFFVATGVLSMLYGFFIIFVYAFLDELYKSKNEIPLAVSLMKLPQKPETNVFLPTGLHADNNFRCFMAF